MVAIPSGPRRRLLARDGYNAPDGMTYVNCAYCGKVLTFSHMIAEHAIPLSRGGPDKLSNLVPSCRPCDERKGPLTADEFRAFEAAKDDRGRKLRITEVALQIATVRRLQRDDPSIDLGIHHPAWVEPEPRPFVRKRRR